MNLSSKMDQTQSTSTYLSKGASSSREEDKALRGFCGVDLRGGELDDPSGIIIFRDQDKGQTLIPRHESWNNCVCVHEGRAVYNGFTEQYSFIVSLVAIELS